MTAPGRPDGPGKTHGGEPETLSGTRRSSSAPQVRNPPSRPGTGSLGPDDAPSISSSPPTEGGHPPAEEEAGWGPEVSGRW